MICSTDYLFVDLQQIGMVNNFVFSLNMIVEDKKDNR
jgi:hypothetical protein